MRARTLTLIVAIVTATGCSEPSAGTASSPRPPSVSSLPAGDDTTVESVTDGDTIRVAGGIRVRLIGIDTPETSDPRAGVECFGPEASARLRDLVPSGTPARLAYDVERVDRYGRTLAYLYRRRDGEFVNAAMVRDGYANAYTVPPNVAHADELVALEREARAANRGLWSGCRGSVTPPAPAPAPASPAGCDPSYPDVCIPPGPPDLDCGDIRHRRFRVAGADPHRFDAEGDGIGCESG